MEISLENLYENIGIERVNKKTIQGGNKKIREWEPAAGSIERKGIRTSKKGSWEKRIFNNCIA